MEETISVNNTSNTIIAENELNIKHKLQLDPVEYSSKPNSTEIRKINDRIVKHTVEIDITKFSEQITSPHSRTWIPAHLEGSRKNDSWRSQSIFALDFDDGITITKVLERLRDYGLDCTFVYSTFSNSTEKPKFRVIWQLSEVIADRKARDSIQTALMELFPEADKACKDAARIFFGGKELIYKNYDSFLDVELMIHAARLYNSRDVCEVNVARSFARFNKRVKLEELRAAPIVYIDNAHFSSNSSPYLYSSGKRDYEILERVDWDELADRVKIFADLLNSTIKLEHRQLLGLATSLVYMKGGAELFVKCINANPDYSQSEKKRIINDCRKHKYNPAKLSFSPYKEDKHYESLYQAAKLPKGKVIRLRNPEFMTLKEAEIKLTEALNEALADTSNSIWIIKKATGLGGTEKLLNLEGITIAFPNHALKEEVATRFKVPYTSTPELPLEAISEALRREIEYLYEIGLGHKVYSLLQEQSVNNPALGEYLDKSLKAYASKQTVLTTHAKALFVDFDHHNTVIFDEDPLASILQIGKVSLNDLNNLIHLTANTRDKEKLKQYAAILTSSMDDCIESNKEFIFDDLESIEETILNDRCFDSSILKFIQSQYYAKDSQSNSILRFITHNSLNSDVLAHKKIIILSATANEWIYKKLYGDRVKFIDISHVEMAGVVIQDTQFSYSRSSLTHELREKINDKVSHFKHLITFAPYKHYFPNAVEDVHYGKCTGFDGLKGENIAVVGTPHLRHIDYLLYAKALGLQVCPQDFRMELRRVQHNGYEFRFRTFAKSELQLIQFHFIEEQMIQAIGRARLLRLPGEVMVFSNYPLPFSHISELEIAQGKRRLESKKPLLPDKINHESELNIGLAA